MFIVNLLSRSLVIIVGIGIAFGIAPFQEVSSPFHEIFGSVVILFGIYRMSKYISARRAAMEELQ